MLIALDTAADMFGGNENDRSQVRQFIGLLRGLAITPMPACCWRSHPSLSGINTDSGLSGSTGWHNSVRSRLYFKARQGTEGEKPTPTCASSRSARTTTARPARVIRMMLAGRRVRAGQRAVDARARAAEQKTEMCLSICCGGSPRRAATSPTRNSPGSHPPSSQKNPKPRPPKSQRTNLGDAMRRLFAAKRIRVLERRPGFANSDPNCY